MYMKVKVWKILTLLLIAVFALTTIKAVFATGTLQPSFTIPGVGGGYVVYDSGKNELFAEQALGGIAVVSDSDNSLVTTINTGAENGYGHELVYDSGMNEIFESSGGQYDTVPPTVNVISDSSNTVLGTANLETSLYDVRLPLGMAYDSAKGEIFICDLGLDETTRYSYGGGVLVVSDTNNTAITEIYVPSPQEAVYDSNKGEIFATSGSDNVSVISDSTNTVIATITVGNDPYGLAYDSTKGEVFVFNEADGTISVISDNSNSVVATIKGIAAQTVTPISIAYDPAKGEIFASNVTISDSTNTVVAGIPNYSYPDNGGNVAQNFGDVAYDSGKGEMFASGLILGMGVFSDSSSPSTSPSTTSTSTATSTPKVPEFSSAALISVAAATVAVTLCTVALTAQRRKASQIK
jgi:YVTN family beta-propeller protein